MACAQRCDGDMHHAAASGMAKLAIALADPRLLPVIGLASCAAARGRSLANANCSFGL